MITVKNFFLWKQPPCENEINEHSLVQIEENTTTILQSAFLKPSSLSIKERKQDVVPQAMGFLSVNLRSFLMLFPNQIVVWKKKRIVERTGFSMQSKKERVIFDGSYKRYVIIY